MNPLLGRIKRDYIHPIGAECEKFAGLVIVLYFLVGILVGFFGTR
jgi:hypothetical protein